MVATSSSASLSSGTEKIGTRRGGEEAPERSGARPRGLRRTPRKDPEFSPACGAFVLGERLSSPGESSRALDSVAFSKCRDPGSGTQALPGQVARAPAGTRDIQPPPSSLPPSWDWAGDTGHSHSNSPRDAASRGWAGSPGAWGGN